MSNTNSTQVTNEQAARIAAQYIAAWNEPAVARRRGLIAEVFTSDASYVDPMMQGRGHDGLDAMIAGVQQQFPGFRFHAHGTPDGHNNVVRFSWALGPAAGAAVAYGTDVAVLAEDGRISNVTGFLDTVAQ